MSGGEPEAMASQPTHKMKPYGELHTCPECGTDTEIIVYPYVPAITAHCYDDNSPPEGGYVEPSECQDCGCEIDYEDYAE